MREAGATFECFGSQCSVFVIGDGDAGTPDEAVAWARSELLRWHRDFTRFEADSELSRLNENPSHSVDVSPAMARFVDLVVRAGRLTGGLVDATLLGEIEAAGYTADLAHATDLRTAVAAAPPRRCAGASRRSKRDLVRVDLTSNVVFRPPGVRFDSGGLAKGLFADILAETLGSHDAFAVDCAGDLRIGGRARLRRPVQVSSPFDGSIIHTFTESAVAAATSGIGRRSWIDGQGAPCHHLLDPATGRPAFTGVVQVTALSSKAAGAEVCAKAAILSGPERARGWLPDGGVVVYDDGQHEIVEPVTASQES